MIALYFYRNILLLQSHKKLELNLSLWLMTCKYVYDAYPFKHWYCFEFALFFLLCLLHFISLSRVMIRWIKLNWSKFWIQMNFTKFNSSYVPTSYISSTHAISWFCVEIRNLYITQLPDLINSCLATFLWRFYQRGIHFTSVVCKYTSWTEITVSTARDSDRYCPHSNGVWCELRAEHPKLLTAFCYPFLYECCSMCASLSIAAIISSSKCTAINCFVISSLCLQMTSEWIHFEQSDVYILFSWS